MPEVKYLGNKQSVKERFAVYIRGTAATKCHGIVNLSKVIGMSPTTMLKRMENPMGFKLDELCEIRKAIGGTKEDFLDYIGGMI